MRVGRVLRDASAVGRAVGPSLTPTQPAAPLSARTTPQTDQPGSRPAARQRTIPASAPALNARIPSSCQIGIKSKLDAVCSELAQYAAETSSKGHAGACRHRRARAGRRSPTSATRRRRTGACGSSRRTYAWFVPLALPNARQSRCRQHHALIICRRGRSHFLADRRFREASSFQTGVSAACHSAHIQRQPTMRRRSCLATKANDGLVQRAPMRWIEVGLFIEVLQFGFETLVDQQEHL
jgi:hypothetical protein